MRCKMLAATLIAAMAFASQSHAEASITLDHVKGLYGGDTVWAHTPIEFSMRFRNNSGVNAVGFTSCWQIWTHKNGAFTDSHSQVILDTIGTISTGFDGGVFTGQFSNDGTGMDTVRVGGYAISGPGMADGFDEQVAVISTILDTPGDTLCIDSTWTPPGWTWLWSTSVGTVIPDWDGPHCFHVIEGCCTGSYGNVDHQGGVDMSDLTMLVNYIFPPHTDIPCLGAGNFDGEFNAGLPVDISDATFLIAYLFLDGAAPPDCP